MLKSVLHWLSFAVMMFSILFNTIDASLLKKAPAAKTEDQLLEMQGIFEDYSIGEEITVISLGVLDEAQRDTIVSLQGLVAREKPSIFIDFGSSANKYALAELENAGYTLSYNDEDGKYTLQVVAKLTDEVIISSLNEKDQVEVYGVAKKFIAKTEKKSNTIELVDCFVKKTEE